MAAVILVAVAGGIMFLLLKPGSEPPLPELDMAQLDSTSSNLVARHLVEVRQAPQSGTAWGRLGALLRSYEFRDAARQCLEEAERLDPQEPRWPYLHGLLLVYHQPAEAIAHLRQAVALCGNEPDAPRLRLAHLLAEDGEWEAARRELEQLVQAQPNHAPALLALARVAQATGDLEEALALASRCVNDRRTAKAAWTLLATLHLRRGDTKAAQEADRRAALLPPDAHVADPFESEAAAARGDPRLLSDQAQRFLMARRLDDAAPIILRMVQEHPDFEETWLLLGRLQLLRQQFPAAEQSIRRHLQISAESATGYFQLGMALMGQKRHAEAAEAFARATQFKPDFGPAFHNLGLTLAKAGRKREAVAPFREAIRHNPEHIESYILLADLYLQLGQVADASAVVKEAEGLNPADRRLDVLRQKMQSPQP